LFFGVPSADFPDNAFSRSAIFFSAAITLSIAAFFSALVLASANSFSAASFSFPASSFFVSLASVLFIYSSCSFILKPGKSTTHKK
jgi:hypothetical protein